jgi:hypothetical protein
LTSLGALSLAMKTLAQIEPRTPVILGEAM